jgi:mono/diheme cytochrome c family protein
MRTQVMLALFAISLPYQTASAADTTVGSNLFNQRCAMCHGNEGAGDGPLAGSMPADQKPRNLSEGQYKYATDHAKLKEVIHKGGAAVGLSVLMPAQSDLSEQQLEALAHHVASLKKQ